jgi:hypothetical protein
MTCSCGARFKVATTSAGKSVKCHKCSKSVKIPAAKPAAKPAAEEVLDLIIPPATNGQWDGDWIEVNEACDPPAAAPAVTGDWGQALFDGHDVPEKIQKDFQAVMTKGEKIFWCDRPLLAMMLHQARLFQLIAGPITGVVTIGGLTAAVIFFTMHTELWFIGLVGLIFALLFGFVCYMAVMAPTLTRRNANNRPCFILTNRRAMTHNGTGLRMNFGMAGSTIDASGKSTVTTWSALQMFRMARSESKKFEGAGDLTFNRSVKDETSGGGFINLGNVRAVEKMVREKMLHPVVDKLLRGERLSKAEEAELARSKADDADNATLKDPNIKDAPGAKAVADDPSNIKNLGPSGAKERLARVLAKAPKSLRKKIDEELTVGEEVLWIDEPDAGPQGRGFFGAMSNAAKRIEPKYDFYALTNRRVLLFVVDNTAPNCFYSPDLLPMWSEPDKRIKDGGDLIFRLVHIKITTTYRNKSGPDTTKVTYEDHYFGALHIRNLRDVEALVRETLLRPLAK